MKYLTGLAREVLKSALDREITKRKNLDMEIIKREEVASEIASRMEKVWDKIGDSTMKPSSQGKAATLTRGFTTSLSPEAQAVINRLGGDPNSLINDAILKYGRQKGIVPSVIITPDGVGNIEIPDGRSDDMNNRDGKNNGSVDSMDEIEKIMARMLRMKMMKQMIDEMKPSKGEENDGFPNINKMLQLNLAKAMIKEMYGSKEDKSQLDKEINRQIEAIKKEINDAKRWEELVNSLKGDRDKFGYEELIKIYAQRDKEIEKARQEAEAARQQALMVELNNKISRLEDMVASRPRTKEQMNDLVEQIRAIKEISSEIKGEKTKSKGEAAKELIEAVSPVIKPLAEAASQRLSNPPSQVDYHPVPDRVPDEPTPSPEDVYSDVVDEKKSTAQVI